MHVADDARQVGALAVTRPRQHPVTTPVGQVDAAATPQGRHRGDRRIDEWIDDNRLIDADGWVDGKI